MQKAPKNRSDDMMLGRCLVIIICGDVGIALLTVEAAKGNHFAHSVS